MANHTKTKTRVRKYYPLLPAKERILLWRKAKGIWESRKPDPIKELNKMRREWERELDTAKR